MAERPFVSVIVPVYNVSAYLDRCVESILAQSYDRFELLLIDDGSTDDSGQKCDRWAERDGRIRVYHKPNGGLSDARNCGIDRASGAYLTFVDSDDYLGADCLQLLVGLLEEFGAKLSIVGMKSVYSDQLAAGTAETKREALSFEEAFRRMSDWAGFGVSACAKLYHRSLFDAVRYPVGKLYEDMATTPYLLEQCEVIAVSDACQYFYYQRSGSITKNKVTDRFFALLDTLRNFVSHFSARDAALRPYCVSRAVRDSLAVIAEPLLFQADYYEKMRRYRSEFHDLLQEGTQLKRIPRFRRLQAWLILHSLPLHRIIFRPIIRLRRARQRRRAQ